MSLPALAVPLLVAPMMIALSAAEEPDAQIELAQTQQELAAAIARLDAAEQRINVLETEIALAESEHLGDSEDLPLGEPMVVQPGEVVSEAVAFAAPVHVHGRVDGEAVSFGDDVRIFNGGQVAGDAVSFGGRVVVDPGGAVAGDRISYSDPTTSVSRASTSTASMLQAPNAHGFMRTLARKLVLILTFAGAGVLVVGLFPKHVENVASTISARPMRMGLLGAGLTTGLGFLALLLLMTVLLSPLSLAIGVALGVAWLLGFVGLCQAAGDRLPIASESLRRWIAFLVGVVVLAFMSTLPFVGQLFLVLIGFICIGAALHTRFGVREMD